MTRSRPRTGICLVRLEEQSDHVLLTLLTTRDVGAGTETRRSFVDVDEALSAVRAFVEEFLAGPHGDDSVTRR